MQCWRLTPLPGQIGMDLVKTLLHEGALEDDSVVPLSLTEHQYISANLSACESWEPLFLVEKFDFFVLKVRDVQ